MILIKTIQKIKSYDGNGNFMSKEVFTKDKKNKTK